MHQDDFQENDPELHLKLYCSEKPVNAKAG
jgi:hypothetical protein